MNGKTKRDFTKGVCYFLLSMMAEEMQDNLSELLKKALDGDAHAYREFLISITPMLRAIAHKVFNKDDVPDVLQDIFLSLHRSLPSYDPKRPIRPWIVAIANRRVVDYIRKFETKAKSESLTEDGDVTNYPLETNQYGVEEVYPYLKLVPDETRRAITLTKIEGHTTEEAAKIMGIAGNALRTKISRGIAYIRRRLEEDS